MKLLVFSDLHEDETALEALKKINEKENFDYVLICGDVSRSISFAEDVFSIFPKAFIVPGNWDSEQVNELLKEQPGYAHAKRIELNGFNVVGFGYSPITPFGTFGEMQDSEIYKQMKDLPIDNKSLLMLHTPPKGYFDAVRGGNAGSESILKIITDKKPFAAFFGHIHEYSGTEMLGSTNLVKLPAANAMKACIVEISDTTIKSSFVEL